MLDALGSRRSTSLRRAAPSKRGEAAKTCAFASIALVPLAPFGCGSRTGLIDSGGAAGRSPTSCQPAGPGVSDCGLDRESCCLSIEVTGGTYYRTYTNVGAPIDEADPASVSNFKLDKYEVTVGRFRRFTNAWKNGWLPAPGSGKHVHLNAGRGLTSGSDGVEPYEPGWTQSDDGNVSPTDANLECDPHYATWTVVEGANERLPITCVSWAEAYAFCILGRRLSRKRSRERVRRSGRQPRARVSMGHGRSGNDEPIRHLRLLLPKRDGRLRGYRKHRAGWKRAAGIRRLGTGRRGGRRLAVGFGRVWRVRQPLFKLRQPRDRQRADYPRRQLQQRHLESASRES
jgi:hypothetical protein